MTVVEFTLSACLLVLAINQLWMVPTSISGTFVEWMVWWVIGTLSGAVFLISLKRIDQELEVGD